MNFIKKKNNFFLFFFLLFILISFKSGCLDLKKEMSQNPIIRRIIVGTDSLFYDLETFTRTDIQASNPFLSAVTFPSSINSFYFEFNTLNKQKKESYFRYMMEGFDKTWSAWTNKNIKEYTNLQEGKYQFKAQIEYLDGQISPDFSFNFEILPPIYRTTYAYFVYIIFAFLSLWTISKYRTYQFAKERFFLEKIINERTEELIKEKDKSENLLANVLPKDTADEIKTKGKATKRKYNMATVLFSDIQGFTKIAAQMNPETLIDELDKFFFHFDSVVEKYNIEKIKTIGDAYMCAGGIPDKNRTNPVEVVLAALEMRQYMKDLRLKAREKGENIWDIRIGIHTGSVIAGVVGQKKLSYDIWGDTVNVASRMESSGEAGKINISGSTYELVKDFFICEYRGKMPVKYKGEIDMYFVMRIRPELSVDLKGLPNKRFLTQVQILRLADFEEAIITRLEGELPKNLYFHDFKHTINVSTQVELLGRAEGIDEEDLLHVKTAALLHNMGFLKVYDDQEEAGCEFAQDILPQYKYNENQIEKICELIRSTKMPPKPENLLEEIICDANLDYLGRVDFIPLTNKLFMELKDQNKVNSKNEWLFQQIEFIKKHNFYTKTERLLRDVSKEEQIKKLKELLDSQ
jgi:adenylate cyclase